MFETLHFCSSSKSFLKILSADTLYIYRVKQCIFYQEAVHCANPPSVIRQLSHGEISACHSSASSAEHPSCEVSTHQAPTRGCPRNKGPKKGSCGQWLITPQLRSPYISFGKGEGIFGDILLGNGAFSTCNQLAALQQNKRRLPILATQCGLVNSSVALFTHQRFEKEENFFATTGMQAV